MKVQRYRMGHDAEGLLTLRPIHDDAEEGGLLLYGEASAWHLAELEAFKAQVRRALADERIAADRVSLPGRDFQLVRRGLIDGLDDARDALSALLSTTP